MSTAADPTLAHEFVQFAVESGVLRFGQFKTKAGRLSPYFFNAGLFDDGTKLKRLAEFYARRLLADDAPRPANTSSTLQGDTSQVAGLDLRVDAATPPFEMVFGPAYKGITLAAVLAVELARRGRNVPLAYNRKEAKDHGEGGSLVGAPVAGRVLIVDDVISAGTSVRESVALIEAAGGTPCGVVIALDRQERTREGELEGALSAVQFVRQQLRLPVVAIATLDDLLQYLRDAAAPALAAHAAPVQAYRERYGVCA